MGLVCGLLGTAPKPAVGLGRDAGRDGAMLVPLSVWPMRWCSPSRRSGSRITCSAALARLRAAPLLTPIPGPPACNHHYDHRRTNARARLRFSSSSATKSCRASAPDKHPPKVIEAARRTGPEPVLARIVGDDRAPSRPRCARPSPAATSCSAAAASAPPDDHTRYCAAALGVGLELRSQGADRGACDVARERQRWGGPADNVPGSAWACSPARLIIQIPQPRSRASAVPGRAGACAFRAGFPVMAQPMIEQVLDRRYPLFARQRCFRTAR